MTKTKKVCYHVALFLLSGMVVLNIYIAAKNAQLADKIQYYSFQAEQLKKENLNLIDERNKLIEYYLSNIYRISYIDLQFHYLESKLNTRISLDFYLNQILSITPSTVQIDQIIFNKNKIHIQATTGNYSDIGYYIKELENHELFKKIEYSFKPNDRIIGNYIVRNLNCKIDISL